MKPNEHYSNQPLTKHPQNGQLQAKIQKSKLNLENVNNLCAKAGFEFDDLQIKQLTDYVRLLQKWNRAMNLVGKNSWYDILTSLVLDSFYLAKYLDTNPKLSHFENIWDLGAGAGIPGIPLRIVWDKGFYFMVEAREKRSLFLQTATGTLDLKNTKVFHGRAENFMQAKQEQGIFADLIISRAFMPYEKMLPFVEPYLQKENTLKPNGSIIFLCHEKLNLQGLDGQWQIKDSFSYKIDKQTKFICEVEKITI